MGDTEADDDEGGAEGGCFGRGLRDVNGRGMREVEDEEDEAGAGLDASIHSFPNGYILHYCKPYCLRPDLEYAQQRREAGEPINLLAAGNITGTSREDKDIGQAGRACGCSKQHEIQRGWTATARTCPPGASPTLSSPCTLPSCQMTD